MGRTVAELSPEEVAAYREAWRKREAARREILRRRAERAWAVARNAARLLKEEFGARRVVLFGSLARGEFDERSDVDLAAEGLGGMAGRSFCRAAGRLQALDPGFSVDLVEMGEVAPSLKEAIEREGIPL